LTGSRAALQSSRNYRGIARRCYDHTSKEGKSKQQTRRIIRAASYALD